MTTGKSAHLKINCYLRNLPGMACLFGVVIA
jgi:hypothetical protein